MKTPRWWKICPALALVGLMLWVAPGFAQGRGKNLRGPGSQCPMGWGQGQGGGPGSANCPNYPGYQNSRRYGGNASPGAMGSRGPRGGMGSRFNQPSAQPSAPTVNQ